jgi:cytochrome c oxidase subunit 2
MTGARIRSPLARLCRTSLFALLLAFALAGCGTPDALNPATNNGSRVFNLFVISMVVSALVFLLVIGLLAYIIIHFREGAREEEPSQTSGNRSLEIGWTVAPAIVLTIIFILTMRTMLAVDDPPPADGMQVEVIGHQWWWEYRYQNGDVVTANELHLPVGQPIQLNITAADVIHSFWVPQIGWKMDAIPNKTNTMTVRFDSPGEFDGACAEYCGTQHAWMRLHVVAQPADQFQAWLQQEAQPAAQPAAGVALGGQQVFLANTCQSCHTIAGTSAKGTVGPDLTHFGSRPTIGTGVVDNTDANLRDWIKDPKSIKPGVLMPGYTLSQEELTALVSYLEGLK